MRGGTCLSGAAYGSLLVNKIQKFGALNDKKWKYVSLNYFLYTLLYRFLNERLMCFIYVNQQLLSINYEINFKYSDECNEN